MPVSKNTAPFSPDTHNLLDSMKSFRAQHKSDFTYSVSEIEQVYGGRRALAEHLAELSGTKVKSQMENVRRWANWEQGIRGKQARNPEGSKKTIGFLDQIRSEIPPKNPNKRVNIQMDGTFKISGDIRQRKLDIDIEPEDLEDFLKDIENGDIEKAYDIIFNIYGAGGMEAGNDVVIKFNF